MIASLKTTIRGVPYSLTNECLTAITTGMNVGATDNIFAVAGSGDQAFALLERARAVSIIDWNAPQIEYVRSRVNAMKREKWDEFFKPWSFDHRDVRERDIHKYFNLPGRLKEIARKVDSLNVLEPGEFINGLASFPQGTFNKVYCSNVYVDAFKFGFIGAHLPLGGLIYSTQGPSGDRPIAIKGGGKLVLERDLTTKARTLELQYVHNHFFRWIPTVFVRKS